MPNEIKRLEELLIPIGFILKDNKLYGPEGTVIDIFYTNDKYCIKKYPEDDYSGKPLKWGVSKGLSYDDTLIILRQIFLYVDW